MSERIEGQSLGSIRGALQDTCDAINMSLRDLGNIVRPIFPVVSAADLLDQLRVDGPLDLSNLKLEACLLDWLRTRTCLAQSEPASPDLLVSVVLLLFLQLVSYRNDLHLASVFTD